MSDSKYDLRFNNAVKSANAKASDEADGYGLTGQDKSKYILKQVGLAIREERQQIQALLDRINADFKAELAASQQGFVQSWMIANQACTKVLDKYTWLEPLMDAMKQFSLKEDHPQYDAIIQQATQGKPFCRPGEDTESKAVQGRK